LRRNIGKPDIRLSDLPSPGSSGDPVSCFRRNAPRRRRALAVPRAPA